MSFIDNQMQLLRSQLDAGFLIKKYCREDNKYIFYLQALEKPDYKIGIPDSETVRQFISSKDFSKYLRKKRKFCVVLLDLVGFSRLSIEKQLDMIVRYQCEVRRVLKRSKVHVRKLLSIGDGTIFIFDKKTIPQVLDLVLSIDNELSIFNVDFAKSNIPFIKYRIGIHVGYAFMFKDINKEENYIGRGVNIAQRVASYRPDQHKRSPKPEARSNIYVSSDAYKEFMKFGKPTGVKFADLGDVEVKYREKVHIYALHRYSAMNRGSKKGVKMRVKS